jgi:hypothetical protein
MRRLISVDFRSIICERHMSQYVIPTISSLLPGYDCTIPVSAEAVEKRLVGNTGRIRHRFRVFHNGRVTAEEIRHIEIQGGKIIGPRPEAFVWRDCENAWDGTPGFLDNDFRVEDGDIRFAGNTPLLAYSFYSAAGKKSFLSDNAYKFSSPPVIAQIAAYGRFVDTYSVVRLDRERDYGDSLVLINPYQKPILCTVMTMDGRKLPRLRIPALSARYLHLENILEKDETAWAGEIQLTANNRLITFDVKHKLSDIRMISDHEHLDPFRGDPTHMPIFQWCRSTVGNFLSRQFSIQVRRRS